MPAYLRDECVIRQYISDINLEEVVFLYKKNHITNTWEYKHHLYSSDCLKKHTTNSILNSGNLPRVLNGMGIAIITTSQGVMSNKKAKLLNIGGEVLCHVW